MADSYNPYGYLTQLAGNRLPINSPKVTYAPPIFTCARCQLIKKNKN